MTYKKVWFIYTAAGLLLITVMLWGLKTGYTPITRDDISGMLSGEAGSAGRIFIDIRLPRVITAVLSGAALALSGAILQSVMQNPLADSGIVGINSGAGLAVLLLIIASDGSAHVLLIPGAAFLGGLAAVFAVIALSYSKTYGLTPMRLVLNGIAAGAGISALMIVLSLIISRESYQFAANFLAGTVWGSTWTHAAIISSGILVILPFVLKKVRVLDILGLGTLNVISLGVNIKKERMLLLACAAGLSAASVSVSGGIAFAGLIAPHLARTIAGTAYKHVLPLSAVMGGVLVLAADTAGRVLFSPAAMPAGIMVAIIGAPYFLYMLMKSESR